MSVKKAVSPHLGTCGQKAARCRPADRCGWDKIAPEAGALPRGFRTSTGFTSTTLIGVVRTRPTTLDEVAAYLSVIRDIAESRAPSLALARSPHKHDQGGHRSSREDLKRLLLSFWTFAVPAQPLEASSQLPSEHLPCAGLQLSPVPDFRNRAPAAPAPA